MRKLLINCLAAVLSMTGAARAETLAAQLKLTPAQQPFYDAWDATRGGDPSQMKALSAQQLAAGTATAISDNFLAWAEYNLVWTRRYSVAIHNLYTVLTPAQRLVFDAVFKPKSEKDAPDITPILTNEGPVLVDHNAAARTNPDWSRKPTGDELEAFYPPLALQHLIQGDVTITCDVTTLGVAVGCAVIDEEPLGYGFGNATIEVASTFRFHPPTAYGVPVFGKVTVPIHWTMSDDRPSATP